MIWRCTECGMMFEGPDTYMPTCPNEQTGLETHALVPALKVVKKRWWRR